MYQRLKEHHVDAVEARILYVNDLHISRSYFDRKVNVKATFTPFHFLQIHTFADSYIQ